MEINAQKRIIICCDGTYDDFGDTPERTKPGSSVSRLLRWFLPPILYHVLWLGRLFALIKYIESWTKRPNVARKPLRSNVSRLATSIFPRAKEDGETGSAMQQLVFYIGGIGALGTPQSRVEEAVTGNTMSYKIRQAYRIIMDNYMADDEILLFGFSRGAFTVRATAGFIRWAGILKKDKVVFFDDLWHEYVNFKASNPQQQRPPISKELRDKIDAVPLSANAANPTSQEHASNSHVTPRHLDVKIRCLGVWDTVGSLGPPPLSVPSTNERRIAERASLRHGAFDIGLGPEIEHVFQALALDEGRFDFYPAIMEAPRADGGGKQVFAQTWFPGVHGDIGGYNKYIGDYPFIWMASKILHHKLLGLDEAYIEAHVLNPLEADPQQDPEADPVNPVIGPRDWFDRSSVAYRFLPPFFNIRRGIRNPHMAAKDDSIHDTTGENGGGGDRPGAHSGEQTFHWTVVHRIKDAGSEYWEGSRYSIYDRFVKPLAWLRSRDASRVLRRVNPSNPSQEITKDMIISRMDEAVGMDKKLKQDFEQRQQRNS